jgi:glucosamine-6-phosphate deaminase
VKIETLPSAEAVARRAAALFTDAVRSKPGLVVALPTGRTPIAMYEMLARLRQSGELDPAKVTCFNLDEVLLPKEMPQTFFQFMTRHAWEPLGIAADRRFIPDGSTPDPEQECRRYESALAEQGGLDLALLGIGADGHIAYNLPRQVAPRTHVVELDTATVATLGGSLEGPVHAITMGIETIRSSRRVVLLATGASKSEALLRMRDDAPSPLWPCTLLRGHANLTVVADEAAASQL